MNREEMNREIRAFFAKARALGVEKQTMLGVLNRLEEVTKQRDDLLAAMKKAREEMSCANFNSAAERIDHAIEDAEKGTPDNFVTYDEETSARIWIDPMKGGA